ncbi:MAG: HEAT repeat domain-containing protein [Planctomycetota bacterium]
MTGRGMLLLALLAGVGWGVVSWKQARDAEELKQASRREPFVLPRPDDRAKAAYFFQLLSSGKTIRMADQNIPAWRILGRAGLLEGGTRSLDYLLDPALTKSLFAAPNRLTNILQLLPAMPEATAHPRYEPFLRYWLDPRNCPPDTPGFRAAEEIRKDIFATFRSNPPAWSTEYCEQELRRADPLHDHRQTALAVLLYHGRTKVIREVFDDLPPNEEEPDIELKAFVLNQMRSYAASAQVEERREGVRQLDAILRKTAKQGDLYARALAASTRVRLGEEGAVDTLLGIYEEGVRTQQEELAWSALLFLAEDVDDPRVATICWKRLDQTPRVYDYTYRFALKILAVRQIDDETLRERIWDYVAQTSLRDLNALQWLNQRPEERPRIAERLREGLRSGSSEEQGNAIRFLTSDRDPYPEVLPDLLQLAQETPFGRGRARLFSSLASMRFAGAVPYLQADLADPDPVVRAAAAANLLTYGSGTDVAERLDAGDEAMLGPIVTRAGVLGRQGVPKELLEPLLRTVERGSSEAARLRALFALRCRGTLEGVETRLMRAYELEPSGRIADAIRETLVELAHR